MFVADDEKVREIRDHCRMTAERTTEASSVSRQVFVPSNILTNTFVFDTVSFLSILTLMVFIGRKVAASPVRAGVYNKINRIRFSTV